MITDDADLVARAVIMSGAYEHNWSKHIAHGDNALAEAFGRWQNKLPLYNLRLNNLSAAIIRPQLDEIPRRVRDGRAGHDYVAGLLEQMEQLEFREVREPGAVYYLETITFSDREMLRFELEVTDPATGETHPLAFRKELWKQ
jgi:dTDP-4-amino-4,6-dideoxygalactose transaminase